MGASFASGNGRVTLADIGRAVGVDASTVSLVLNDKPLARRIKAETKAQILAAAQKLGYQPSASARALRTGKSGIIGMVVGDIASGFYSAMTAAALKAAESHDLQLLVVATEWNSAKERKALEMLMQQRVDGILCLPATLTLHRDLHERFQRMKVPAVTYDCAVPGAGCVKSDYHSGMQEALADLSKRHRCVEYISSKEDLSDKFAALQSAAGNFQMEVRKWEYRGAGSGNFDFDIRQLYSLAPPHACIVNGDEQAMILIDQLLKDGREVPHEFEVVGIDGLRWTALFHPRFATIKQDCTSLMEAAFDLLTADQFEAKTIHVPTRYIPANS